LAFGASATLLDNFNRANETPIGGNWTPGGVDSDDNAVDLSSNAVVAGNTSPSCTAYWNAATFGPDVEVYLTVATKPATSAYVRLYCRVASPNTTTPDGYMLQAETASGGTDLVRLFRMDDGGFTQIGSSYTTEWSSGDLFGVEAVGDAISAYRNTGGGWTQIITATDGTYSAAGSVGFGFQASGGGAVADDFYAGTVVAAVAGKITVVAAPLRW
jgi:hypothetical protein